MSETKSYMSLQDMKNFLNSLPETFNDFCVVNGEFGTSENDDPDSGFRYRVDKPILAMCVDQETKEVCFLHQTQEEVDDYHKEE